MRSQSGRRRWVAGALRAGRAAAFLTLATGINGTAAALEPRYEPIYVYLIAVVIVAWAGSILLGVTTAVAAIILYDAMFSPLDLGLSWAGALPLLVAVGAAVVTRLARVPLEHPRTFAASTPPPLLETSPPKVVEITPAVFDTEELEDLRQQLADAGRMLDEARDRAEREGRLRIEQAATAKARLAGLQRELDAAQADVIEQAKRAAAVQVQLDDAVTREKETAERNASLQGDLEAARQRTEEAARESEAELQRVRAELAAKYQEPLAEAKRRLEEAFTRVPGLEKERDAAKSRAEEAAGRMTALERLAARLRTELTDARAEAEFEHTQRVQASTERDAIRGEIETLRGKLQSAEKRLAEADRSLEDARSKVEIERSHRERLEAETDRRIASIADGLTRDYEESLGQATVEKEAARAEVRALSAKVESLQKSAGDIGSLREQLGRAHADLEEARSKTELERAQRERVEADFDRRIASIAEGLTKDYEESLGDVTVEREAARAEIRSLTSKLEKLEKQLSDARSKAELERAQRDSIEADLMPAARAEIAALTSNIESLEKKRDEIVADYSARLTVSEARAASLMQQVERMERQIEDLRSRAELERSAHERALGDFDRKITSIVAGITSDHEQTIGEAMVEKEAARAEARSLTKKVETLQKRLEEEQAARARLDAEWSEKLQTIVNHLAADHEADLGEAILEKQEAKAEVRQLTQRLKTIEQKLEFVQRRSIEVPLPSRPLVLVVHSDPTMRAMSKHTLEDAGYEVLTAADGLEGLRVASTQRPAVVLAEAVMPKMNGRELVQLLKARSETAFIKVILMNAGQGEHGGDFRADDILATPIDFAAMKATLADVLAR